MRFRLIVIISTFLISCKSEISINLHPLESNLHLDRQTIEKHGFQFYSADHGLCMYQKQFDTLRLYFLFSTDDDCNNINLQGLEFPFDEFEFNSSEDSSKLVYGNFPMDIYNDSLRLSTILAELGGKIISNKKGYKNLVNRYDIENIETGQILSASIHYQIDSKKYLNIEVEK